MTLHPNLGRYTARELKVALIIARRKKRVGETQRILAEHRRRGIKP